MNVASHRVYGGGREGCHLAKVASFSATGHFTPIGPMIKQTRTIGWAVLGLRDSLDVPEEAGRRTSPQSFIPSTVD